MRPGARQALWRTGEWRLGLGLCVLLAAIAVAALAVIIIAVLAEEQVPVGLADDHFEDDETPSSLRYASEAVPAKRGTDVALVGHAYPRQGFAKALDVQLQVGSLQQSPACYNCW